MRVRFLTAAVAQQIDRDLMSPSGGFSIDQLMELAGLACAEAVFQSYPPSAHRSVLIACGPGNQGGDGLVAARHLQHFGYAPRVWYPKEKDAPLFRGLVQQLRNADVEFVPRDAFAAALDPAPDVILDAIFGFSFQGEPRDPFRTALQGIIDAQRRTQGAARVVSVDIPSSWGVDAGPDASDIARAFRPDVLVSLTAPKTGSLLFQGHRHWLGGRFVDSSLDKKFRLSLPPYPGTSQVVDITGAEPTEGIAGVAD
ncbi:NAD(P)H-hydrate epimerase [Malassezia sp. CBS 17886]|nr:NAD(P)H-hydrate epimerase [Malassezia sp. CBS 17886]